MTEINQVLKRAGLRLMVGRLGLGLLLFATSIVGALILVRLAQRLFAFPVDWAIVWTIAGAGAALGAVVWSVVTRPDRGAVARTVDEKAGLREAISTAVCVAGNDDPWSRAAVAHAASVSSKVRVRHSMPYRAHRAWWAPLAGIAVFMLAGLLPQSDLLNILAKAKAEEQVKADMVQAREQVKAVDDKLNDLLSQVKDEQLEKQLADAATPAATQTPEELRRTAIKKLTAAQDRVDQLRSGDKGQLADAMKERMERLRQPGPGPLDAASRALQQGKFQEAKAELSKLADKLASEELPREQKEQLENQLKDLADQLDKLAKDREDLERKLEEAGLDKKLASDPEALQKALEAAKNLSQEQKQKLAQAAKACKNASKACENMGQACKNAADGMQAGEMGLGELDQMGQQLSELEMLQSEMDSLEASNQSLKDQLASMGQCMSPGDCLSPFACEGEPSVKDWARGEGRGAGKRAEQESAFNTEKKKSKSPNQPGPIIGSMVVQGDQVKGESVAQFAEAIEQASQSATEAIETKQVPREYHDAIKHYFGRLEKKAGKPAEGEHEPEKEPAPEAEDKEKP